MITADLGPKRRILFQSLPPAKRLKLQHDEVPGTLSQKEPEAPLQGIFSIIEIFKKVISFLSPNDLLTFETTYTGMVDHTQEAWNELRKKEFYLFEWACAKETKHSAKWNFCLSAALSRLVLRNHLFNNIIEEHILQWEKKKIHLGSFTIAIISYNGLVDRFPSFGFLIAKMHLIMTKNKTLVKNITQKLITGQEALNRDMKNSECGGELMVQALAGAMDYFETIDSQESFYSGATNPTIYTSKFQHWALKAIEKQATCISLLSLESFPGLLTSHIRDSAMSLAKKAADQGDTRALRELVANLTPHKTNELLLEQLVKEGYNLPFILANLAIQTALNTPQEEQAAQLLIEAMEKYGNELSQDLLNWAGCHTEKSKKFHLAEMFYNKILEKGKVNIDIRAENIANFMLKSNKLEQAQKAFLMLSQWDKNKNILERLADINIHLKDFEAARGFYHRYVNLAKSDRSAIPIRIWIQAAEVASILNHWDEALEKYKEALSCKENKSLQSRIFIGLAFSYLNLDQREQAKKYFDNALKDLKQIDLNHHSLKSAIFLMMSFHHWNLAKDYSLCLFDKYKDQLVVEDIQLAVEISYHMKEWQRMACLCQQLIDTPSLPESWQTYILLACAQSHLKEWKNAVESLEKFPLTFEQWNKLSEELQEEVKNCYYDLFAVYKDSMPIKLLNNMALIELYSNQYEKAKDILNIIIKEKKQWPASLFAEILSKQLELNHWKEIKYLHSLQLYLNTIAFPWLEALVDANENGNLSKADHYFQMNPKDLDFVDSANNACFLHCALLAHVAMIKFKLLKPNEAAPITKKILLHFSEGHNHQFIEQHFDQMLTLCKDHPPAYLLANTAFIKFELKKWQEALDLYSRAISAYGNEAPIDLSQKAQIAKDNLSKN